MDLRGENLEAKTIGKVSKGRRRAYVAYPVELLTIEQKEELSQKICKQYSTRD